MSGRILFSELWISKLLYVYMYIDLFWDASYIMYFVFHLYSYMLILFVKVAKAKFNIFRYI